MTRKKNQETILKEAVEITKNMNKFLIKKKSSVTQGLNCLLFLAITALLKDGTSQRQIEILYRKSFKMMNPRVKKSEKSEQE